MKETIEETFAKVWDIASRWEHLGTRDMTKKKGAIMIGHIPEKGRLAHLHWRFNGLDDPHIADLEERLATLRLALPEELAAFLRLSNGLRLFHDELAVYGSACRSDPARKRKGFWGPCDLFEINEIVPKAMPRSWLRIARVEGARVDVDCDQDMSVVFKCKEGEYEPIKTWPSFGAWLLQETRRLAKLYTKAGERK